MSYKKMLNLLVLLAVTLTVAPAQACSIHDKLAYRAVAENFCAFLDSARKPDTDLFTPALLTMISDAEAKNAVIAKARPDEKPPLGDGIPYQAFPDGSVFCRAGTNLHKNHQLYMEVVHIFPDTPDASWTDQLKLRKVDGLWKVDDVFYGHDYKHSLRDVLKDAFTVE